MGAAAGAKTAGWEPLSFLSRAHIPWRGLPRFAEGREFLVVLLAAHGHTFHQSRILSVSVRRDAIRDRGVLLWQDAFPVSFSNSLFKEQRPLRRDATSFNAVYRRLWIISVEVQVARSNASVEETDFAIGSLDVFVNNTGNSSIASSCRSSSCETTQAVSAESCEDSTHGQLRPKKTTTVGDDSVFRGVPVRQWRTTG